MNKGVKYSLKFLGWFVLGIIVLLLLIGLLIQTRPVKKKIAEFAVNQTAGFVNGEVTLGEIEGNFFTHLQLNNLLWKYKNDTVAYIEKLDINYDLQPLITGHLLIYSINISEPFFHLKQINDSTWNVQQLIKSSASESDVGASSSGNFQMDLSSLRLTEGRLAVESSDTLLPKQILHLNTNLELHWEQNLQTLKLNQFSFISRKPDVMLKELSFHVTRDTSMIDLSGFSIKTQQNQLNGRAVYQPNGTEAEAHLQSTPLQPNEFEFLLPFLKIPVKPVLNLNTQLENDSLELNLTLKEEAQNISLNLSVTHFIEFLSNPSESSLEYQLNGKLENINLAHWTGISPIDYLVNGQFHAHGKGTNPKMAMVKLQGIFNDCLIENKPVAKLTFDFNLNQGNLTGKAEGSGDFGQFNLHPDIKNLFDSPTYQFELTTHKLNLAELLGNDSLRSDINLKTNISGQGFELNTLSARATLDVTKSQFQSLGIDTLLAEAQFQNSNLQIDSLWLKTQSTILEAHGNYALNASSEMWLSSYFTSISDFKPFIPIANLHTNGQINAHLQGTTDSLNLETSARLNSISYNSFFLDSLVVNATAGMTPTDTLAIANLQAFKLQNNEQIIDSVSIDVKANTDSMFFSGRVTDDDINTRLKGRINWQQKLRIALENWILDYKNQHLALQSPPAVIEIDSTNYSIHNFKLASNTSDTAQFVSMEGNISRSGNENFELKIDNVDIEEWMKSFGVGVESNGIFRFSFEAAGTSSAPILKGSFEIDNAELNKYKFTDFGGTFDYQNNRLNMQSKIVPVDSGKIEISGLLPMQIDLDSFNFDFNPKDSVDFQINVDKFPLAVAQTLNIRENIAGFIDGRVKVNGTAESPNPNGDLRLIDAAVKMPEYGIDYHDILFNLSFLRDKIKLDTLRIKTADGDVTGSGDINFSSDFYKGNISQSKINLKFDQFNPVDHRQFNMQVSGNANLGGKKGDVAFGGDLNIPEAEIYLPAVLNMMGKIYIPDIPKPILVQALEEQNSVTDTLQVNVQQKDTTNQFNLDYFNQLTGKIRIKIPKNTWVKNEDLRIELSGDLELIKHKTFFELFGSVEVVRGQYNMLGKTFVIDEGTITFEGGEDLMPKMDLTASYTFRNAQREEKKLTVNITGTADSPSVSFMLDEDAINEGDALSYILFGKSMNELSIDQQDNLTGAGGGQLAERAAASILSSQISNFLSKKLNVDYIEVKSDGGFDNATVVVGKYLTNDLFVSYEQRFGTTDQTDIAKYEVKLEYELFKFLFFQLNNSSTDSGFDVIFKISSK